MGGDAMFRTIKRSAAKGLALHVLITIASFADEDGLAYPSLRQIEKRAKVSRHTVIAGIRQLIADGQLRTVPRGHRDRDRVKDARRRGGFQPTHYYQVLAVNPVDRLSPGDGQVVQPLHHLGGAKTTRKVVQKRRFPQLGSLLLNESVLNKSARRRPRGGPADEQIIGILVTQTHALLDEDPMRVGEPLLDALMDWAKRRHATYGCSTDALTDAIERALRQRKDRLDARTQVSA
jgi:Helix-turn-helix domain